MWVATTPITKGPLIDVTINSAIFVSPDRDQRFVVAIYILFCGRILGHYYVCQDYYSALAAKLTDTRDFTLCVGMVESKPYNSTPAETFLYCLLIRITPSGKW